MLYVALGRNVGDEPMSEGIWKTFVADIKQVICDGEELAEPDTLAYGVSQWGGMLEDTCVMVWFEKNSPLAQDTKGWLGETTKDFGQEAIAYTIAPTEFVMGV